MAELMLVNPRGRRRRRKTTRKAVATRPRRRVARRRSTSRNRVARSYRRNPIKTTGIMNQQVVPAAINASGALALDVIWGFLPIPDNIKTGAFRHFAKGAGAIAMGMVAGNVVNRTTARELAKGALTVVMHDAAREMLQAMMPTVPLGYYTPAMPVNGFGAYVEGATPYSPYLANETLSKPFADPSGVQRVTEKLNTCLENEGRMGACY